MPEASSDDLDALMWMMWLPSQSYTVKHARIVVGRYELDIRANERVVEFFPDLWRSSVIPIFETG